MTLYVSTPTHLQRQVVIPDVNKLQTIVLNNLDKVTGRVTDPARRENPSLRFTWLCDERS